MKFLCLSLLLVPFLAQAAEGENFAEMKAKMVTKIEERIQKMQEHKNCVSAAADKEALKACHKDMKEWRKDQREESKEMREKRRDARKHQ